MRDEDGGMEVLGMEDEGTRMEDGWVRMDRRRMEGWGWRDGEWKDEYGGTSMVGRGWRDGGCRDGGCRDEK